MNHAIKLGRFSLASPILSSSYGLISICSGKGAGSVRFVQVSKDPQPNSHNMDKTVKNSDQEGKHLNVMRESFGEAYSSRSDDEGFGGIYGGNDECNAEMKIIKNPAHHESNQGSEVKEKEKGRNQENLEEK